MPERIMSEMGRQRPRVHSEGQGLANPTVTFACPTAGRAALQPDLLNEVVYWYLRQTYPFRELLILNDAPEQELWCHTVLEAAGVRIINWPVRIPTLGEKRNLINILALGPVILPQDDDDVSLPWRAEQAVKGLAHCEYWTPGLWWYYEMGSGRITADGAGVGHNCSAYRRAAFYNRYEKVTLGEDARVHDWACKNLKVCLGQVKEPDQISYVYRWGVSHNHVSGWDADKVQDVYDNKDMGPPGRYEVKAVPGVDWVSVHNATVERLKE